jgi:hypothetical protein
MINRIRLFRKFLSNALYIKNIRKNEEELEVMMRIRRGENMHKEQEMTTRNGGGTYPQSVFQLIPLSESIRSLTLDSSTAYSIFLFCQV